MPLIEKNKKIPSFQLSLNSLNLALAIWLGLVLNSAFYQKINSLTPYTGLRAGLFIGTTMLVIIAAYFLIFQLLHWRRSFKLLAVIWIILGGLASYFVNQLGIYINSEQIQNGMQTDLQETLDLVTSQRLLIWALFFVLLPLLILSMVKIKKEPLKKSMLAKSINILLSLSIIGGSLYLFYVDYAAIFRENREIKNMISPQNVLRASYSYYKHLKPQADQPIQPYGRDAHQVVHTNRQTLPKLMIIVIGETARAESFQLNGYARPTNPQLSKQNIIYFNQVSSCGTATAVSLPCMLSGMTRSSYEPQTARQRENLLDIAKHAGYAVTWISNSSGCKEVCNRVENYQAPATVRQPWCDTNGECKDDVLVDSLEAYLKQIPATDQQPRLIVLHQMGSHGPAYYKRTTPEFVPFQPICSNSSIQGCSQQALINTYDNSILYTDHILNRVINTLKSNTRYQAAMWYVSDHGESTGEHGLYLHSAPYAIAPSQQTHIPMLSWFSANWQQQNQQQVICIQQQKNSPMSHDMLFPTLLHLMDIHSQTINDQLDLSQQCTTNHHRA